MPLFDHIALAKLIKCSCRAQQTYISPSDNIQSPATQKLNAFKSKQMSKYVGLSP